MKPYKFFDHTADTKFQAYGQSLEEAFENAAKAMFNVIVDEPDKIRKTESRTIQLLVRRPESLLYDFLNELLFYIDVDGLLLCHVDTMLIVNKGEKYRLTATMSGDNYKNYDTQGDIKAVTYNDMLVEERETGWIVQVVVDI